MRELRLEIPFQAYPWFPVPDALTREQPDGALAGPPDVIHPPYALFRDARPPIPKRFGQRLAGAYFRTSIYSSVTALRLLAILP
jgi:hypothetical protein